MDKKKEKLSDERIISRATSVRKIARKLGYAEWEAEEISQTAVENILESPSGCETQNNYYLFVDALRKSCSAAYTRRGRIIKPIFEHQLPKESHIISGASATDNVEQSEFDKEGIFNLVSFISTLKNPFERTIVILYIYYEWTFKSISLRFGVTESRICQIYSLAQKRIKALADAKGLSSSEQSQEQQSRARILPPETETLINLSAEGIENLSNLSSTQIERKSTLGCGTKSQIQKALCRAERASKTKKENMPSKMAKIKLERKSFICPKMEKKTINFWPQKRNLPR